MQKKLEIFVIVIITFTITLNAQVSEKFYRYTWNERGNYEFRYCNYSGTLSYTGGNFKNPLFITSETPLKIEKNGSYVIKNIYGELLHEKSFENITFTGSSNIERDTGDKFREFFLGSRDDYSFSNATYNLYSLNSEVSIYEHPFKHMYTSNNILMLADTSRFQEYYILPKDKHLSVRFDSLKNDIWVGDKYEFGLIKDLGENILYGKTILKNKKKTTRSNDSIMLEIILKIEPEIATILNIKTDSNLSGDSLSQNEKTNKIRNYLFGKIVENEMNNAIESRDIEERKIQDEFENLNLEGDYTVKKRYRDTNSIDLFVVSKDDGNIGLITSSNKILLPFKKRNISIKEFYNTKDYVILEEAGKYEYNVFNGNGIKANIEPIRSITHEILNNETHYVVYNKDRKYGLLNSNFDIIRDIKYSEVRILLNKFLFSNNSENKIGNIEFEGKEIFSIKSDYISVYRFTELPFIEVSSSFEDIRFHFLIDEKGNCILPEEIKNIFIENDIIKI
jgi:hypothetical protein